MRIRTIKPEFFKDDKLAECSPFARLLFAGLWCMADRRGRLEDRPKRIKAELLPYDSQDVESLLSELSTRGFIVRYNSDSHGALIQVCKFEEHQRITGKEAETESEYPKYNGETTGKQLGNNGETTETTGMEGNGREWNGREWNGRDGMGTENSAPAPAASLKTPEVSHREAPPTVEAVWPDPETVLEYAESVHCGYSGFDIEAAGYFLDHYRKIGKPLADWKAALRTWKVRDGGKWVSPCRRGMSNRDGFSVGQKYHEEGPLVFTTPDGKKVVA